MIKSGRGIDVYMVIEIHGRLCETGALEPGAYCTGERALCCGHQRNPGSTPILLNSNYPFIFLSLLK